MGDTAVESPLRPFVWKRVVSRRIYRQWRAVTGWPWVHGNAGIPRELLRYVRVASGRDPGYAVALPDQPIASP
ncbi:hypothetical protein Afil01_31970 [Actinorhabdospora filicis]|uniref:Uncharacterized protein n=1 Tax=Actinorhabdospora filicis TaxID=1785913 RepID=A0A9W6SM25_9ACTN|nr:hypothetical protein Afil01_31970 [Actinorhabdospora filicis]